MVHHTAITSSCSTSNSELAAQKTHLVAYTDGERFPEDLRHKKHKFPDMSNDVINPDAPSDSDSDEGIQVLLKASVKKCQYFIGFFQ